MVAIKPKAQAETRVVWADNFDEIDGLDGLDGEDVLDQDPRPDQQPDQQPEWCEHPAPASLALIVGEDRSGFLSISAVLTDLGFDALLVPDAAHALESMERLGGIELLLTADLELIATARRLDGDLPVVALVEADDASGSDAAWPDGEAPVGSVSLNKPYSRWELMVAVDAALEAALPSG